MKWKNAWVLISVVGILLLAVHAYAGTTKKQITISDDNVCVYINGNRLAVQTSQDGSNEVFLYNGTVYGPIRKVAEALDYQVSWDSSKKSVYIIKKITVEIESFRKITKGMSTKEVEAIVGKPNENVGSGRFMYGYRLIDGSLVTIIFDEKISQVKATRVDEWVVHSILVNRTDGTHEWIIPGE